MSDNIIEITKRPDGRRFVKLPDKTKAVDRRIAGSTELPDAPNRTNPIALVVCYDLYGLPSSVTASALNLTEHQIEEIRETVIYDKIKQSIINNIGASDNGEVKEIFVKAAKRAAEKLVEQLDSNSSAQAISAAMKILEGAGMSPNRGSSSQDKMAAGLSIVFLDNTEPKVIDNGV
jgi:hypothetical protein